AVPEDLPLFAAPILGRDIWPEWADLAAARAEARAYQAEGLMLKRVSSPYFIGRKKGDWWKWKL
ncbi:MAG TPA: ATP-dependent DNA ligase, partial [Rhodobacteraceae bacterium]|nr:ATP-dependent DNA ligase [Paracoccaceae bacterium]